MFNRGAAPDEAEEEQAGPLQSGSLELTPYMLGDGGYGYSQPDAQQQIMAESLRAKYGIEADPSLNPSWKSQGQQGGWNPKGLLALPAPEGSLATEESDIALQVDAPPRAGIGQFGSPDPECRLSATEANAATTVTGWFQSPARCHGRSIWLYRLCHVPECHVPTETAAVEAAAAAAAAARGAWSRAVWLRPRCSIPVWLTHTCSGPEGLVPRQATATDVTAATAAAAAAAAAQLWSSWSETG